MATAIVACGGGSDDETASLDADGCSIDVAPPPGESAFCRGKANFSDRKLAGLGANGRSCADCHVATESFQLTPATAQARFTKMMATSVRDPLFHAIDADDFRVNGVAASDFTNLTQNALVRVTIALPANVKLLDCGATVPCPASARPTSETVADVWRAVPSILDVRITGPDGLGPVSPRGPNPSGGYQLDGRIDTLQSQALAALRSHAAAAIDPPAGFLDDLAAFQNAMFSSPAVKLLADSDREWGDRAARPRPGARPAGSGGQAGLRARLRPMPWQPGRPSQHQRAAPAKHARHADRHRALSRHPHGVPATGRHGQPAALLIHAVQRRVR